MEIELACLRLGDHAPRRRGIGAIPDLFAPLVVRVRYAQHAAPVDDPLHSAGELAPAQVFDAPRAHRVPAPDAHAIAEPGGLGELGLAQLDVDVVAALRRTAEIVHPYRRHVPEHAGRVRTRDRNFLKIRTVRVYRVPAVVSSLRPGGVRIADGEHQALVVDPVELEHVAIGEVGDGPSALRLDIHHAEAIALRAAHDRGNARA